MADSGKRLRISNGPDFFEIKDGKYHLSRDQLAKYELIYINGGHAPMVDLKEDPYVADILHYFDQNNKFIVAICHGPIAFHSASWTIDRRYGVLYRGGQKHHNC